MYIGKKKEKKETILIFMMILMGFTVLNISTNDTVYREDYKSSVLRVCWHQLIFECFAIEIGRGSQYGLFVLFNICVIGGVAVCLRRRREISGETA